MAIFLEQPTPFIEEFLDNIVNLTYPKAQIDLFIHYAVSLPDTDIPKVTTITILKEIQMGVQLGIVICFNYGFIVNCFA